MGNNDKWTDRQSEGEKDRRREKLVLAIGISKIYIKSKKNRSFLRYLNLF